MSRRYYLTDINSDLQEGTLFNKYLLPNIRGTPTAQTVTVNALTTSYAYGYTPKLHPGAWRQKEGYYGIRGDGFDVRPENVKGIKVASDGQLYLMGRFEHYNGNYFGGLLRMGVNRVADFSFDVGIGFNGYYTEGCGYINGVLGVKETSGNKLIVWGSFLQYKSSGGPSYGTSGVPKGTYRGIIRLHTANAQIDTSFAGGGVYENRWLSRPDLGDPHRTGFDKEYGIYDVDVDPSSNKIIAVGHFGTYNDIQSNCIVRILANGAIDNTFSVGEGFDSSVFSYDANNNLLGVSIGNCDVFEIKIRSDGKYVCVGNFLFYNRINSHNIIVLNTDGTPDTTWTNAIGSGGPNNNPLNTFDFTSTNQMIVGGNFTAWNGVSCPSHIARINSNGSLDTSFNSGGSGFVGIPKKIIVMSDGKILVGGNFSSYNGIAIGPVVRLQANGALDTSFSTTNDSIFSWEILTGRSSVKFLNLDYNPITNKVYVALNSTYYIKSNGTKYDAPYTIAFNYNDGSIDPIYNSVFGFNSQPNRIALQSTGKLIAAGNFTFYKGKYYNGLVRLDEGQVDSSFNSGGFGFAGTYQDYAGGSYPVRDIIVLSDDKIYFGGDFTSYNGVTRNRIVKVLSDGSLDTTFDPGTGFNNKVISMSLQSDGKIVVVGDFSTYNGITANKIVRINTNGSYDTTFNSGGTGFVCQNLHKVFVDNAGSILVCGWFSGSPAPTYNGVTFGGTFLRLTSNGAIDNTFSRITIYDTYNNPNPPGYDILQQSDGKYILCGRDFYLYGSNTAGNPIRVTNNGTFDATFNPGTYGLIYKAKLAKDGSIYVGGQTYFWNTTAYDGGFKKISSDNTFNTNIGSGPRRISSYGTPYLTSQIVSDIAIDSANNVYCCGDFLEFNSNPAGYLVKLTPTGTLLQNATFDPTGFASFPSSITASVNITTVNNNLSITFLLQRISGGGGTALATLTSTTTSMSALGIKTATFSSGDIKTLGPFENTDRLRIGYQIGNSAMTAQAAAIQFNSSGTNVWGLFPTRLSSI